MTWDFAGRLLSLEIKTHYEFFMLRMLALMRYPFLMRLLRCGRRTAGVSFCQILRVHALWIQSAVWRIWWLKRLSAI